MRITKPSTLLDSPDVPRRARIFVAFLLGLWVSQRPGALRFAAAAGMMAAYFAFSAWERKSDQRALALLEAAGLQPPLSRRTRLMLVLMWVAIGIVMLVAAWYGFTSELSKVRGG